MLYWSPSAREPDAVGEGTAALPPVDGLGAPPVYQQKLLPDGHHPTRIIATHINWEAVGSDPAVIAENSARIPGRIKLEKGQPDYEPVAVVAYGASLRNTWEQIKDFNIVYTCSGAHQYLLERGVGITYHVDSDPRAYKADILGKPDPRVTYLLASICHPTYFDKLELHKAKVKLWHMLFLEPEIFQHFPRFEWIMTGGHTVGPRTIKLARMMGHANLHMFGFDGSVDDDGRTHATEHPNPPRDLEWIEFGGRKYFTNRNWEDHAAILLQDFDRMPEVRYQFHGEGLIQEMAKRHVPVRRAPMPWRVYRDQDGKCAW